MLTFAFHSKTRKKMEHVYLYTFPQYFIFLALLIFVYGWVEKKQWYRIIGMSLITILGLFALFALLKLFPASVLKESNDIVEDAEAQLLFWAKLKTAYFSFVAAALSSVPTIWLERKQSRKRHFFTAATALMALFGFFIIVSSLK